mmetsp:Transcript_142165/g.247753  ORF Transcript_142165/g.247753 Transcript_142165/m.247753 type:complete len:636 (+) Transcript_142165:125-2032(+)
MQWLFNSKRPRPTQASAGGTSKSSSGIKLAGLAAILVCICAVTGLYATGRLPRVWAAISTAGAEAIEEVEEAAGKRPSLRESLTSFLGHDDAQTRHMAAIKDKMISTFHALPKNEQDQIGPRSVRYMVHNYFARESGWRFKGLDSLSDDLRKQAVTKTGVGIQLQALPSSSGEMDEVGFLQDKAPELVRQLLAFRESDQGLALDDVVVIVSVLEHLIADEYSSILHAAYRLNRLSPHEVLDERSMQEVLTSFLIIVDQGSAHSNLNDVESHLSLKADAYVSRTEIFQMLQEFQHDAVLNYKYSQRDHFNPFVKHSYDFDEISFIAHSITGQYGKWQNSECSVMKDALFDLGKEEDSRSTGRLLLSKFYSQPVGASTFVFGESENELRDLGALDETSRGHPRVLIANYLLGPSNCIASSRYYSVCCLDECEGLMNELEASILAPAVKPEQLLPLVGNLSSSSVDAPRKLPDPLVAKLNAIAKHHEGVVPLHSRLFAQWLHFAFPSECPYPQMGVASQSSVPMSEMPDGPSQDIKALEQTKLRYFKRMRPDSQTMIAAQPLAQWTDDEVMLVADAPRPRPFGTLAGMFLQVAALAALFGIAAARGIAGVRAHSRMARALDQVGDRKLEPADVAAALA